MSPSRQLHNIALVGFMGTGKTSVGSLLAHLLRFRLVDTDDMIERRVRKRIAAIFAEEGEEKFREYERLVVEEISRFRRVVISTGGGLVANPAHLESLKSHALTVCLWASPETIWTRVRHQAHRPLLNTPDPLVRIRQLLAERECFYRQADVLVSTEFRSVRQVAQQVAHQFRLARMTHPPSENQNPSAVQGTGI